jgi:hypothetical protein
MLGVLMNLVSNNEIYCLLSMCDVDVNATTEYEKVTLCDYLRCHVGTQCICPIQSDPKKKSKTP